MSNPTSVSEDQIQHDHSPTFVIPQATKFVAYLPILRRGGFGILKQARKITLDGRVWVGFVRSIPMHDRSTLEQMRADLVAELHKIETASLVAQGKIEMLDKLLSVAVQTSKTSERGHLGPTLHATSLKGMGPTQALEVIIATYALDTWLSNRQIRELLLQHGYEHNGNNFYIGISKALRRLDERHRIQGKMEDGEWRYRALSAVMHEKGGI